MIHSLIEKLADRWPIHRWQNVTIIIGCSGGADSVALVSALSELKPASTTLVIAHFNHRLRGDESDADQAFVEELASKLNMACEIGLAKSQSNIVRDESTLRDIRYDFLRDVAGKFGARYVAIAHTADDSVETTLHNLIRGTGLKGLAGIPPFRDLGPDHVLIRPMIDVWRTELDDYLRDRNQSYRQDSSNQKDHYTRNRIRNQLIPFMTANFCPQAKQAIHRTSMIVAEAHDALDDLGRNWLAEAMESRTIESVVIRRPTPKRLSWPAIQLALASLWRQQQWPLQAMSAKHWAIIRQLSEISPPESTSIELPGKIKLTADAERWTIESF
jgi:tRNA(Ile)-lysidine synthase